MKVYVALDPPYWTLDEVKLLDAFTTKTKALVLNRYMFLNLESCTKKWSFLDVCLVIM